MESKHRRIVIKAAGKLDKATMIQFDERMGYLHARDLGRTASHFYIKYDTVEVFNELMKPLMNKGNVLAMLSRDSHEFVSLTRVTPPFIFSEMSLFQTLIC